MHRRCYGPDVFYVATGLFAKRMVCESLHIYATAMVEAGTPDAKYTMKSAIY
jgi:hypothetical protein